MSHNVTQCSSVRRSRDEGEPLSLSGYRATIKAAITLISCGGTWQWDAELLYGGNYSRHVVLRAEKVPEADAGLLTAPDGVYAEVRAAFLSQS